MKTFVIASAGLYLIAASAAHAADAEAGKRLAQLRCAACHVVGPGERNVVSDAPPFVAIGRKFGFNYDSLVAALSGPHRKMNFVPTRREAEDVAAYITTLAK